MKRKHCMQILLSILVNIARAIVGLTFVFSGFVKAVDPVGLQYKLEDYLEAMGLQGILPEWLMLTGAVLLSTLEFLLGIMMLFAINRRRATKIIAAFMVVMTGITIWIYVADPVSDCGCFGDAIKLTNGETLLKNIVLLACAALLCVKPLLMPRFIGVRKQWLISYAAAAFTLGISMYAIYYLPLIDFRPYHVGANIKEGMEIPDGAEQPEYETTFIMEKDGVQKEFSLEDYPDSTWTFIDSKTKMIKAGYEPPIHDFEIQECSTGDDITEEVLSNKGYTLLMIAPHLETADDSQFGEIDRIYEYAKEKDIPFYCLTASGKKGIAYWMNITGAEYPFCHTDEITLKTIIRSNPGILLLKNGVVMGKWSYNNLPKIEELPIKP